MSQVSFHHQDFIRNTHLTVVSLNKSDKNDNNYQRT